MKGIHMIDGVEEEREEFMDAEEGNSDGITAKDDKLKSMVWSIFKYVG